MTHQDTANVRLVELRATVSTDSIWCAITRWTKFAPALGQSPKQSYDERRLGRLPEGPATPTTSSIRSGTMQRARSRHRTVRAQHLQKGSPEANAAPLLARPWLRHNVQPRPPPGYPLEPFANPRASRGRPRVRSAPGVAPPKGAGGAPSCALKRVQLVVALGLRASSTPPLWPGGHLRPWSSPFLTIVRVFVRMLVVSIAAPNLRGTHQPGSPWQRPGVLWKGRPILDRSVLPLAVRAPNAAKRTRPRRSAYRDR